MPKKGNRRKKTRTHVTENESAQAALTTRKDELKVPKSLVIRRGRTAAEVADLVHDLRSMMMPFTALKFQENPRNRKLTLSQYATHLALPMGISHMMVFSQNQERLNMKMARNPEGPTLSFRVHQFSLSNHIKALQKRPINSHTPGITANAPVVVTNNFGDQNAAPHIKLMRITFQNLFPQINVSTVRLSECRRVILFNLVKEEVKDKEGNTVEKQTVQVRHYAVKATPVGINRRVRRLVQAKIPNLHKCQDIADYLQGNAIQSDAPSDSEAEDDPTHVVKLADKYAGKGNVKAQTSALKLVEMGPRLSLELLKVEKGLGSGDVLYHAYIHKTPEEAAALKARKEKERELKEQRRSLQEANVERKRKAAEEKREAKRKRREEKEQSAMESLRQGQKILDDDDDDESSSSSSSEEEEEEKNSSSSSEEES